MIHQSTPSSSVSRRVWLSLNCTTAERYSLEFTYWKFCSNITDNSSLVLVTAIPLKANTSRKVGTTETLDTKIVTDPDNDGTEMLALPGCNPCTKPVVEIVAITVSSGSTSSREANKDVTLMEVVSTTPALMFVLIASCVRW